MIIIVDERELVLQGYHKGFRREGVVSAGFHPEDFRNWLEVTPEDELAAIEAVLLGGAACKELAALVRRRLRAPIIALSEMHSLNDVLKLFSVGVDDVVRKPVHVREIMARVSAIMSRMCANDDGAVTVSGIRIFPDGRPPLVGGEPLHLPRREYRILQYLVMNHDRRVTKRQLFDCVYGIFEDSVEETVIESHISKLRKKLRQRLGYDPIDSRRYLGYCLHSRPPRSAARQAARAQRATHAAGSRELVLQTA